MRFFGMLGLLVPLCSLAAEPRVLREDPIRVTVTIEQGDPDSNALFQVGEDPAFRVKTLYVAQYDEDLSRYITWRAPYLLIRSTTGGNCWDCTGEAVFKVEPGKVIRLGDINTDYRPDTIPPPAPGHFITNYSKLELQAGFCHACSPSFLISLVDRDGHLEVDGDATWALNRDLWLREELKPPEALSEPDEGENINGLRDLAAAAALARYCGREAELLDLQARWEPMLDADKRNQITEALALVKPLEPVAAWNAVAPY